MKFLLLMTKLSNSRNMTLGNLGLMKFFSLSDILLLLDRIPLALYIEASVVTVIKNGFIPFVEMNRTEFSWHALILPRALQ